MIVILLRGWIVPSVPSCRIVSKVVVGMVLWGNGIITLLKGIMYHTPNACQIITVFKRCNEVRLL